MAADISVAVLLDHALSVVVELSTLVNQLSM